MIAAVALLVGLTVGFACGVLLFAWSTEETARPPARTPPPPATLVDRFAPMAGELAKRAFLGGVHATCGAWPPPPAMALHLERGAVQLTAARAEIARASAHAYTEGVREVRAALGERTGLDDRALDEAVAIALEEVLP